MSDPRADRERLSRPRRGAPPAARRPRPRRPRGARGPPRPSRSPGWSRQGLTPELAERESIARLGDPDELADGLRRAPPESAETARRGRGRRERGRRRRLLGVHPGVRPRRPWPRCWLAIAVSSVLGWLGLTTSRLEQLPPRASRSRSRCSFPVSVAYRVVTAVAAPLGASRRDAPSTDRPARWRPAGDRARSSSGPGRARSRAESSATWRSRSVSRSGRSWRPNAARQARSAGAGAGSSR